MFISKNSSKVCQLKICALTWSKSVTSIIKKELSCKLMTCVKFNVKLKQPCVIEKS